jgi:hypothetical protein
LFGGIGTAIGSGIGVATASHGNKGKGAVIGGAAGGAAGAVVGYKVGESIEREKRQYASDEAFLRKKLTEARDERRRLEEQNDVLEAEVQRLQRRFARASTAAEAEKIRLGARQLADELKSREAAVQESLVAYQEAAKAVEARRNRSLVVDLQQQVDGLSAERERLQKYRRSLAAIDGTSPGTKTLAGAP